MTYSSGTSACVLAATASRKARSASRCSSTHRAENSASKDGWCSGCDERGTHQHDAEDYWRSGCMRHTLPLIPVRETVYSHRLLPY